MGLIEVKCYQGTKIRNIFIMLALVTIVIALLFILQRTFIVKSNKISMKALPEDVVSTIKDYHYSEVSDGYSIDIKGKQIVRRGARFMGVRANIIKKNYFEDIRGIYKKQNRMLRFEAKQGEWDLSMDAPFILRKNIVMCSGIEMASGKNLALIDFKRGTVEIDGQKKEIF